MSTLYKAQQRMIKFLLLASTVAEIAESGLFDMALVTRSGKSIPTTGSPVISMDELQKHNVKCTKVIAHSDGSFTGLYNGTYVRFLPFNMGTDQMYYGELKEQ